MTFKEAQEHIKDGCPKCGRHLSDGWGIKYKKIYYSTGIDSTGFDITPPKFTETLTYICPVCGYTFTSEPKTKDEDGI
jgi:rubrerythrin